MQAAYSEKQAEIADLLQQGKDLKSEIDDDSRLSDEYINDARREIIGDIEDVVTNPGQAREHVLDFLRNEVKKAAAQVKRADTNIASGLWKQASIYEREPLALKASMFNALGSPILKGFELFNLTKLSITLGKFMTITGALFGDDVQMGTVVLELKAAQSDLADLVGQLNALNDTLSGLEDDLQRAQAAAAADAFPARERVQCDRSRRHPGDDLGRPSRGDIRRPRTTITSRLASSS